MKPRFTLIAGTAWILAAAATAALAQGVGSSNERAQQEPQKPRPRVEERVTVTANRLPEALEDVASSVTVLTEEEIAASGARWLPELLDGLPGIALARNGGPGAVASVFVRGTNSNHTLVLVDGVKVNSPTTGGYNLAHLAVEGIERVEVVRGPQSALYGSQALGGVIQVFTRRPGPGMHADLGLDGGSRGTAGARGRVGGAAGATSWSLAASAWRSDGISAAAAERGATERDGYRNVTVDGSLDRRLADDLSVAASVRALDADLDFDGFRFGFGPDDDDNATARTKELYAHAELRIAREGWRGTLRLADTELSASTADPDGSFLLDQDLRASIRQLDGEAEIHRGDHTVLAGMEVRREQGRIESTTVFGLDGFDENFVVAGGYAHDRVQLGSRASVMAGARWEHHSTFGDHATFRVAASAAPGDHVSLHATIGSGFRAPSLNDLYFPGFSNPDLEPERSLGADVGVRWELAGSRVRADLTAFHQRIDDLVSFGFLGPENLGRARTRGLEAQVSYRTSRADGSVAYTLTDAEDRDTGALLLRRPRHRGALRGRYALTERLGLYSELVLVGARDDFGAVGITRLSGYALWNAAADLELGARTHLRVRLDNLLDRGYEEVFGFGSVGRSFQLGITHRLGG